MELPGSERQGRSEKHRDTQRELREAGGLEGNLLARCVGGSLPPVLPVGSVNLSLGRAHAYARAGGQRSSFSVPEVV